MITLSPVTKGTSPPPVAAEEEEGAGGGLIPAPDSRADRRARMESKVSPKGAVELDIVVLFIRLRERERGGGEGTLDIMGEEERVDCCWCSTLLSSSVKSPYYS